jgi:RNA polymerase sigma factor (sigma-70 family)
MTEVEHHIEALYKDKFGQLLSLLLMKFRDLTIESGQDIVQEAFADAATLWTGQSMPHNPAGWIYQACKNKSINMLKKNSRLRDLSRASSASVAVEEISEHGLKDAQLLMLLACCNPHLTPRTQVVVALKYVANFKVENIALQLGVNPDAIEKMLYRARQEIKAEALLTSRHSETYSKQRISIAHKVIYLIFSEGYKCTGEFLDRGKLLCEEALMLNKYLYESPLCNPETRALQALMVFNIARFATRYDARGNAVELENQDRSLWDHTLIRLGHQLLIESEDTSFSPYHLEAAIAYMHCSAKAFGDTNWEVICKYYEALLEIYPSPFAEINYAVALQYNKQDEKGFRILTELHRNPYYNKLPILTASLAKYFERKGIQED